MPKRLSIRAHLALEALEPRSRRADAPVARRHGQVIWRLAQGRAAAQVAAVTGDTVTWIRTMARGSTHPGPAGLEDRRHHHPGAVGRSSLAQRRALSAALEQPPPDGGRWTGPKRPPGWRQRRAVACTPSGGGRCGGAGGGRRRCRVPAGRQRPSARRPPVKKPPGRRAGGATSLRMRWSCGRPTDTVLASSPWCAASGAPAASAPGPWGHSATGGAISTPLCIQAPAGPGGGCGRRCRWPRSRAPLPKVPRRAAQGRARRWWWGSTVPAGSSAPKSRAQQGGMGTACLRLRPHGSRPSAWGR
jgi:hypothetical protein